jgi:NAD(P)H-nitrite reductase large subunit
MVPGAMNRIVVIGNDRAAKQVVEQILALNPDVVFTVFGSPLPPREESWFRRHRVDLRAGIMAVDIDRFARRITGSDGSRTVFHRLILTQFTTELARAAKLEICRGVLVNSYMQTSDGYVYAMGPSVQCPEGAALGSVSDHAKIIAGHICASSPRLSAAHELARA